MAEALYGLLIQDICRIVFEFAGNNCIHLFNQENKMVDLDFVKRFANPANKSQKVTLKSSKKLNKPKEKVIATDQKNRKYLLCAGIYSKPQSWSKPCRSIADLQEKLTFQAIWKVLIFSLEMTILLKIEKWLEAWPLGCHPVRNGHVTH